MMRPVVTNTAAIAARPKKQLVPQEIDKDVSVCTNLSANLIMTFEHFSKKG